MSIDVIYLDMDGVIADFVTPSLKAAEIPLAHNEVDTWNYFEPFMKAEQFWSKIEAVSEFWRDIRPYPWAHELVALCRSFGAVVFCSSPSRDPRCAEEKIRWLRFHGFMGHHENNYILTPHKSHLSQKGRVLIDDSNKNCMDFLKPSIGVQYPDAGMAIEFPQPWNDSRCNMDDRIGYVNRWLKFFKNGPSKQLVKEYEKMAREIVASAAKDSTADTVAEPKKEDVLEVALKITSGDRQNAYGPPDQDFRRTGDMWTALFRDMLKDGVVFEPFHVAQAMILLKMSRQLHQRKRDNWIDTAGYARCGALCDEAAGK